MTAIDDARSQLRERKKPRQEEPWHFPEPDEFRQDRHVLAFDAALTNCGWTFFMVRSGVVIVIAKGTIRPQTSLTGYLGTWDKAEQLQAEIAGTISRFSLMAYGQCELVVEAPSVGGGSRTESSLIAGMLVRLGRPWCRVISATHVSAVLLGDPRVRSAERKKLIRSAVIRLCPEAAGRTWNEHERDALATGLTCLHDLKPAFGSISVKTCPAVPPGTIVITGATS